MRVLLICNSFGKGWAATAHLAAELGEGWVERGCEVEVWARGGTREHAVESCDHSIAVYGTDGQRWQQVKNRHLSELLILVEFCRRAWQTNARYDRVICMDSPRFAPMAAAILRRRTGAKTMAWVMDLAFEQVSRRRAGSAGGHLAGSLMGMQVWLMGKMDRVVTLGECMASALQARGMPREKIEVIGTWAEDHWSELKIETPPARRKFGLNGRFTIMYSGYAADWHDFDSICEAMAEMSHDPTIQWVFAGSGPGIDQIRSRAANIPADNLVILDRVDREELPAFLSCADVHLVSLKASMLGTCVPSKLYPLMALGKPVVFVGPSACQTALDLEQAQAGLVAGNGRELVEALRGLVHDPERVQTMGENARQAFQKKHNATTAIDEWLEVLNR